jgi:hydroxysqualene dehydroxylase
MDNCTSIIIGGGLSGLSAAVELCAHGHKILLLDQHQYCGGRAYSFIDAATGDTVDNGQHLMMGCYYATKRFLRLIGTEHLTFLQPTLRIQYLHPTLASSSFLCPRLRAPFHMLGGLLRFTTIPLKNRLEMLRVAKELLRTSPFKEQELDQMTVDEWLSELGQSPISKKFLWDVITIGALNNHPKKVSALMLFRVLRAAFLGKQEHSSFLLPRAGLSEVLVTPAVEFIRKNGGTILFGKEVSKFYVRDEKIISVLTQDGKEFHAPVVISAIPWFGIDRLLHNSVERPELVLRTPSRELCDLDRFKASPIISIQLWFDRMILEEEFAAMIDTRVQWVFNKSWVFQRQPGSGAANQHLSLVISGAQEFTEMSKEELIAFAVKDLRRVLPKAKDARLLHSIVLKEKRATFSPEPGLEAIRPLPRTSISNLFLAGDWTNTGFPATIEGAIMSGRKSAELVEEYL